MRLRCGSSLARWSLVALLVALLILPVTTVGAAVTQVQKITPGDGGANDGFGYAVAVSPDGSTAVIGAYRKNTSTGAIYIYTKVAGGTWTLKQEITSVTAAVGIDALAANDDFGFAVAIDNTGTTILAGAPAINSGVRGKAYIFTTANHTTWSVQEELKPTGVGISDQFGFSVALSGAATTALVGAHFVSKAYVFAGSPLNTTPVNVLAGGVSTDFGWSVALNQSATPAVDGTTAIVGAISDQSGTGGGAAYVYAGGSPFSGAAQKLQPSVSGGAPGGPAFGNAVALSGDGNTALVGAPYDTTMSPTNPSGSAFAYFKSGGTFNTATVQRIDPTDTVSPDFTGGYFGTTVALSGDGGVAVVSETEGAVNLTYPTTNPGSVSVYRKSGATFDTANKQTLFASDPVDQDFFGSGLGLSRDGISLLVGAQDVHPPTGPGAAYAFTAFPDLTPAAGALPAGTVGTAYSQQFTATNGAGGPYTYATALTGAPAGKIDGPPPGVTMNNPTPGLFAGTPTAAGSYIFLVTATDSAGGVTTQTYTLTIGAATTTTAVTVTPPSVSYSTASQSIALSATVTSSPPGVAVNEGTVTFTVTQGATTIGSSVGPVPVSGGMASGSYTLPAGQGAGVYMVTAAYTPAATNPSFAGSASTGGTLTVTADATTTTAANASAPFSAATQSISLSATVASSPAGVTVNEGTVTFTVTQGATTIGTPVTSAAVSGGAATANYTLPAGQGGGVYTITAAYTPGADFVASSGTGTLTVSAGTLAIAPATLPDGTVGVPYSQQLTASGGSGAGYAFSAPAASLPPGLTLTAAGLLAGTPTAAGPYTFTVTATDGASNTGSRSYTVTIAAAGPATLSSLSVTAPGSLGSPASMKVGQTAPFTATATFSDGTTAVVTGQAQWGTSNAAVAIVDDGSNPGSTPAGRGTVTGVAGGTATITASYTLNGVTKTGSVSVTVAAPIFTGVQAQPAPAGRPGAASVPAGPSPAPIPAPPAR